MLYSKYGLGDYWCKIRLTIDGDKFNRQPNFHTDDRKQHSAQFKPFDWVHNVYKGTPMAKQYPNGRSFPVSDDSDPMVDYATLKPVTNASHPFFQTEDRMTTDAAYIPNALSYILRIDIILYTNEFDRHNQDTRERLYNAINHADTDKIHIYNGMEQFNNKIECSRAVLTAPCDNRTIKDTKRYRNTDGSINYEYRTYPRAVTETANININTYENNLYESVDNSNALFKTIEELRDYLDRAAYGIFENSEYDQYEQEPYGSLENIQEVAMEDFAKDMSDMNHDIQSLVGQPIDDKTLDQLVYDWFVCLHTRGAVGWQYNWN